MAKQRLTQALDSLLKSALRLDRNLSVKDHRFWLWRSSFLSSSASPSAQAGFILPTVTLLLLMLSLVLGVLIFRTSNRTNQVIGERQQRQVYNAATPAIERAKAKLEVLFTEDVRTVTADSNIENPLIERETYRLPDEKRLDINGDGKDDAAWNFKYDSQGLKDSTVDDVTVVYSILTRASSRDKSVSLQSSDVQKAKSLVVRNGPINLTDSASCDRLNQESPYDGWQKIGPTLRKAIQVHALAIPGPDNPNKTVATLEMQQDKQGNLGNKWGAWFRNDMEVYPGPIFRWNGAINTGGSYFIRSEKAAGKFKLSLYPISAPTSCVSTPENSEMVMSLVEDKDKLKLNDGRTYQGQLVVGSLRDNTVDAASTGGVRLFSRIDDKEYGGKALDRNTDSTTITAEPIDLALEPVVLLTEALSRRRDGAVLNQDGDPDYKRDDGGWNGQPWVGDARVSNRYEKTPFIDDTYRADNRWGPKPVYRDSENNQAKIQTPKTTTKPEKPDYSLLIADPTTNVIPPKVKDNDESDLLTRPVPLATQGDDEESYGYDGYWERRSRTQGVRIVVGQRLELGNAYGWKTEVDKNSDGDMQDSGDLDLNGNGLLDFDPLYPPPANPGRNVAATTVDSSMAARQNELMQWKTLRANPAAAQSTAIYHYLMDKGQYPVACLASAAHPGTKKSIDDSTTFKPVKDKTVPNVNFLAGEGTNGWEFAPFGAETYDGGNSVASQLTSSGLASARGTFETAINDKGSPMRIALSNLAYFSGDLAGAFPAFQDTAGENAANTGENAANSDKFREAAEKDANVGPKTHPYPILTMWGDYSNLRRVINRLDGGPGSGGSATYDKLSLADQTTLQTASCTLGILAYNIENETASASLAAGAATETLYDALGDLSDGSNNVTDGQIDTTSTPGQVKVWKAGSAAGSAPFYTGPAGLDKLPPEVIAQALPDALKTQLLELQKKEQVNRDRRMGFSQGAPYTLITNHNGTVFGMSPGTKGQPITSLQCDFEDGSSGLTRPSAAGGRRKKGTQSNSVSAEQRFLTLAYAICPRSAKYPSLYYLFPKDNHDHVGTDTDFVQPTTEPYTSASLKLNGADFDNRYAHNRGPLATAKGANINTSDGTARFRVVANAATCGTDCNSLRAIALVPKTPSAWALPNENGNGGSNVIDNEGSKVSIALLDKGIFNGREHMGVRVLDVDIDLLRKKTLTGVGKYKNSDFWLPLPTLVDPNTNTPTLTGALLYAFREDAMREDGIARPRRASPSASAWKTAWLKFSNNDRSDQYLMKASVFNTAEEQDPPVNPVNGISPKPVDYFADPSRRPHGFRLRNGANLTRNSDDAKKDPRGLSLISDNSVYIQGDFNLHSTNGTVANRMEEYEGGSKLDATWSNFYARTDLNEKFAVPEQDTWRNSEIIADAVNVLSSDFVDGWISQGIAQSQSGVSPDFYTSYSSLNFPRPATAVSWVAADGKFFDPTQDQTNQKSALKVSQRGFPVYCSVTLVAGESCLGKVDGANLGKEVEFGLTDPTAQPFLEFKENKNIAPRRALPRVKTSTENFVNSLMLSGMTPSRVGQASGGLQNFLRFNEDWDPVLTKPQALWVAGSLFQLNFSHTATAPYDQETWEPDLTTQPQTGSDLKKGEEQDEYFSPPDRRWGFDPALLYVQPSPVASRFNSLSSLRSEFYQELPVDDPYIKNLRCAEVDGKIIDKTAKNCT